MIVPSEQLLHQGYHLKGQLSIHEGGCDMSITTKRIIILAVIIVVAFCLGRLAVRAVMNLLLGGTLFGGNFL